jgi:hypothetical protein
MEQAHKRIATGRALLRLRRVNVADLTGEIIL